MNNSYEKKLNYALETWGHFTRLELGGYLDISANSPLYYASKYGNSPAKEIGNYTYFRAKWPLIASTVDGFIESLGNEKPKLAEVLKWHYTERLTIREQAKKHHLKKSTYHDRLKRARKEVGDFLDGFDKNKGYHKLLFKSL